MVMPLCMCQTAAAAGGAPVCCHTLQAPVWHGCFETAVGQLVMVAGVDQHHMVDPASMDKAGLL